MKIQIIRRQCGGTEFYPVPHRLHLGAQNAAGVDELHFSLPEEWSGCTVALYLRRSDGTLLAPVPLEAGNRVTVDRRLTGCTGGQWMLAAGSSACSCFLGRSRGAAGAFQHAGHELLIQRGRQLLGAAVCGQDARNSLHRRRAGS